MEEALSRWMFASGISRFCGPERQGCRRIWNWVLVSEEW